MSEQTIHGPAKAVAYTGLRQVELIDWPVDATPLKEDEVAGRTLMTLISPGTEINAGLERPREKPAVGGYSAVFEVQAVGAAIKRVCVDQRVFCAGPHVSRQRRNETEVVPLPEGLPVDQAVFAHLISISWSTLTTTTARPPERVLVLGLGLVGNLAAQIFQTAGYRVTGVDPSELRRQIAGRCGIADVRPAAADQADLVNQMALAIDCSGHEQAVLDACRIVRKGGEVVLVGTPWKKRSDVAAFDILHAVFHRYVILRSGWEWQLPRQPRDFTTGSVYGNIAGALQWLNQKRLTVEGICRTASPRQAQSVYDDLLHQRGEHLSVVFDWREVDGGGD